jgi:DNA replication licensing factor MCM7
LFHISLDKCQEFITTF